MKEPQICMPDYNNSILNLITSITGNFNVRNRHDNLPGLPPSELRKFKNIILLILDGFGYNLYNYMKDNLGCFSEWETRQISSVFPPTTTAAISTLLTGKSPLEHGAIGWTLYFKEFCKYIDFLPNWDSITAKVLDQEKYSTLKLLSWENIFTSIKRSDPNTNCSYLTPAKLFQSPYTVKNADPARIIPFESTADLFDKLQKILDNSGNDRSFIYVYSTDPDALEHRHGVYSSEVTGYLTEIAEKLKNFESDVSGSNTLMLVTADHGLIDIEKYYYTNEDTEFQKALIMPVFPEPRFSSLFIKKHLSIGAERIVEKYRDQFLILSRDEFLTRGFLGSGKAHPKLDDFIGDYLMIATGKSALKSIYEQNGKWKQEFKAHHAGLSCDEMQVPLIKLEL